ncbi:type I-F CRISPR-associated protein Csy2 [Selenomonas ruminantium]|uniref:type I-F CRISPR-associated protein Csy2 n=1 Tax=Selenomonas ruminantium TaxID=971 RepID=UPI0026F2E68E|nr:type I-F CRISPR-associated protein Csy2 [Selenomonas ruminantium]
MSAKYLVIPHLHIQNANAASSPYTVGFPAMTAWLGMIHALQRRLQKNEVLRKISLPRMGISCHACDMQIFSDRDNYYGYLIGTANPLKKSKKTGEFERPPFVEEARCHLEISLLVEVAGFAGDIEENFLQAVCQELPRLKAAGGDIILQAGECEQWQVITVRDDDEQAERRIKRLLMPGYVLKERQDLMKPVADKDALDNLLEALQVEYTADRGVDGKVTVWQRKKVLADGWLVPIAVGFRDLSSKIKVEGQRSYDYEHHFVEPLVTIGEFLMPYRLNSLREMLWEYEYEAADGLYLCHNMGKDDCEMEEEE